MNKVIAILAFIALAMDCTAALLGGRSVFDSSAWACLVILVLASQIEDWKVVVRLLVEDLDEVKRRAPKLMDEIDERRFEAWKK